MSKINKVVVKGVSYDIEDAYARKKIDSELPLNIIKADVADMNYIVQTGIYNIDNKLIYDNSPITNQGAISARLTVLVTESGGNKVITQVINLNNNEGGEGNVYIRSCQNGEWKAWGKLQTNVEVGQVNTLDNLTDNGIYSGVFTDGTPTSAGTFYDTFVLIVINNYAVSIPTGYPQSISQLKYSLGLDGSISVASRKRDQYGYWDNWASLDEKSLVEEEKSRAELAEQAIKDKAVEADSLNFQARADVVALDYKTIEGVDNEITIPAATTEKAGVMSAEDKAALNKATTNIQINTTAINNEVVRATQAELDAIEKGRQLALRSLFVAAGAEYNDTDNHIVKNTLWKNYVDSVDYKAQWDLDVVTGSVKTLTYGGKTYEYIDDNGTWKIIARVGDKLIWDDTKVIHRAGYYHLNGLGDITEEQMIAIYNAGIYKGTPNYYTRYNDIRTFLPAKISGQEGYGSFQIKGLVADCKNIEVVRFSSERNLTEQYGISNESPDISNAFCNCNNLKYIQEISMKANAKVINTFNGCRELVWIKLFKLAVNLSLAVSSKISKESIRFIIQKAKPTSAITITLHPDAYARLADDADIVAALEAQPLITLVSA
jgi:hypothetical protein